MKFLIVIILSIPLLFSSDRTYEDGGNLGVRKKNPINIHVISIGINKITPYGNFK